MKYPRGPREMIESELKKGKKFKERAYIKYPGEELKLVTLYSTGSWGLINPLKEIAYSIRGRYAQIHTHPPGYRVPSKEDWRMFLEDESARTMVIAPVSGNGSKLKGYTVVKKRIGHQPDPGFLMRLVKTLYNRVTAKGKKELNKYPYFREPSRFEILWYNLTNNKSYGERKGIISKNNKEAEDEKQRRYNASFRQFLKNNNFLYKFVPARDIRVDTSRQKRNLEEEVGASVAVIGTIGGIFFLSSNFTGNAISNLSLRSSNIIGAVLFLVGIAGAFFYFRKRKS